MLCLSLEPNERCIIGTAIVLTNTGKRRCHIGIEAPKEIAIDREKVRKRKERSDDDQD